MKIRFLIPILLFSFSCNQVSEKKINKNEIVEEKIYWDIPNKNTKNEILNTNKSINDSVLIEKLLKDFSKVKFKIETTEVIGTNSYANCNDNLILKIEGRGIKQYYVKRTEAKPKNYYPDFIMFIYEFENEDSAINAENEIIKAYKSGNGYCNGKGPFYIIRYKNQIIDLRTRAEMFRGYIMDIAEKIKNYS